MTQPHHRHRHPRDHEAMIIPDPSLSFVQAINAIQNGMGTIDEAVAILKQVESQTGVLLFSTVQAHFLDWPGLEHLALRQDCEPLLLSQIVSLAQSVENANQLQVNEEIKTLDRDYSSHFDDEYYETSQLFPFLSKTFLLIEGMHFSNNHIIFYGEKNSRDPQIESFGQWYSMRGWAQTLSKWAVMTGWSKKIQRSEADLSRCFYGYAHKIVWNYVEWEKTVLEVIAARTKDFLEGMEP